MEKNLTQLEGCYQEIEVKMTYDELQPFYEDAYRKARPNIALQGFRKGKVPMNMIKRIYGTTIENDSHNDIISDTFAKIINDEKIRVIGQPELIDIKKSEDKGVTFKIKYEIIPEIALNDYKNLVLDEPVHVVTIEEIDKELNNIAIQYSTFEIGQTIEDEQFVVGLSSYPVDAETQQPVGDIEEEEDHIYLANLNENDKKLAELCIGKSGGDSFVYEVVDNDKKKAIHFTINEIQKVIPAEFTEEFVKNYTESRLSSVDELKEEIGFSIQEEWDKKSRQAMESQVIQQLTNLHPDIIAPNAAVQIAAEDLLENVKARYYKNENTKNIPDFDSEMIKSLMPLAERNVKWELIRNQIIKNEGLQVEDYDVDPIIELEAERTKQDKVALKASVMRNEQFLASILAKKVMDLILEFAETNETTFENFDEKMNSMDSKIDYDTYEPSDDHDHDHDHDHHDHDHDHDHHDHDQDHHDQDHDHHDH